MLYFPAELTVEMMVDAGAAFLGPGSRVIFGTNFPDLEREAGAHCATMATCLEAEHDYKMDFRLVREDIEEFFRGKLYELSLQKAAKVRAPWKVS